MADSQVLTISYGSMQIEGQIVGGKMQLSMPAASFVDADGKARALDPALFQLILQVFLQLLPQLLEILRGGS